MKNYDILLVQRERIMKMLSNTKIEHSAINIKLNEYKLKLLAIDLEINEEINNG